MIQGTRILQLNTVYKTGSTGRIVKELEDEICTCGGECEVIYGRGKLENEGKCYNSTMDIYTHALLTRLTGKNGFYSKKTTKEIIKEIEDYQPDLIHLHNLHGYYLNVEILFEYIKKKEIPIVWTLHDCWSFTGNCVHFDNIACEKWKKQCFDCQNLKDYPKTFRDNSYLNYSKKKKLFTDVKNLTIITPSIWLKECVEESFLGKYDIQVINNGIDLEQFQYRRSNFREKYGLANKNLILGVANIWNKRKGFEDFIELARRLDDSFQVFLVGLDKKQLKNLPNNVIGVGRTKNIQELVEIYSASDVYFNASVEETMGMTTIEALACGVPVVTYDKTAVPEFVPKECGVVVQAHNIQEVQRAIEKLCKKEHKNIRQSVFKYDKKIIYKKYIELYENILNSKI